MVEILVDKLKSLKVKIDLVDDKLEIIAPKGAINKDLAEEITLNKTRLVEFINFHKSNLSIHSDIQLTELKPFYPLSSAQRRLWFLCQFEQESIAYNIPSFDYFSGDFNFKNFEKAIKSTIERHEILRTVFRKEENGDAYQFIKKAEELNFKIEYKDFCDLDNGEQLVENYINDDSTRPFDLENGPLIRVAILKLKESEFVLFYNMHHIISDGWSMNVLTKDVLRYYQAYNLSKDPNLKPLRIQYKDYSLWQLKKLEEEASIKQKKYWIEKFSEEIPILELPFQKNRPLFKTVNGSKLEIFLSKKVTLGLKEFCNQRDGSMFMGLMATLNVLFSRYTHQNDFIIGSPMAGRNHVELEDQIGFYVNTIALRNKINPEESFEYFFNQVRDNIFSAYENQYYPFDRLIEDLQLKKDNSRNPLFDVMLVLQNIENNVKDFELSDINQIVDCGSSKCKYDLSFTFQEFGEHLSMNVEYNVDLYVREDINNMIGHFINILEKVLLNPNEKIKNINYLSQSEEFKILNVFNDTNVNLPSSKNIVELIEEQVEKTPNNKAVQFKNNHYTYKELNALGNQFARFLIQYHKVEIGDIVGLKIDHSEMYVFCLLGILKANCCCSPIDVDLSAEKLNHVKQSMKVLVDTDVVVSFLKERHLFTDSNLKQNYALEDIAYIVYTSGSTGTPKGCMIQHLGIINHIYHKIDLLDLYNNKIICHTSKMYFVGAIWQLWAPLIIGGTVVINSLEDLIDISSLLDNAIKHDVKVLEVIPSQLNVLFSINSENKLKNIKKLILTGEKLTTSYVNKFFKINPDVEIINTYGQTECSDVTTFYKVTREFEKDKILIGKPIQNNKIYILDKYYNLCPIGVVGEICTTGFGVSKGYLNQLELTNEKFIENLFGQNEHRLYRTGDLGRWLHDGNIEILGRIDHQVSVKGYRIELGEIENTLQKHPSIQDVVVLTKEIEEGQISIVSYLTFKNSKMSPSDLRVYLKERLQEYLIPSYFVILEELPLTSNGKIDKKLLPNPRELGMSVGIEYVAPKNKIESELVSIIEKILKCDRISIKDSFYDIGGDSIKLVQLLFQLRKLGYDVKPEQVLRAVDIESVALQLAQSNIQQTELNGNEFQNIPLIKSRKVDVGYFSEISENQKHMMKFKDSQAVIGPLKVSSFNMTELEFQFKKIISFFPELHIKFKIDGGNIYQQIIESDQVKIVVEENDLDLSNQEFVVKAEKNIYEKEYDFFNGELMRLFVFNDLVYKGNSLIYFSISHSLADLYTCDLISKALNEFMYKGEINILNKNRFSSIDYSEWQKEFLISSAGYKSRNFWVKYLSEIKLDPCNAIFSEEEGDKYIEQSLLILDSEFEFIKKYAKEINTSLSSILIAYHNVLLKKYFEGNVSFQMILVNGRDNVIEGIDFLNFSGVINNVLPIKIHHEKESNFDNFVQRINSDYLDLRQNQLIPYEIVRNDLHQHNGCDLDLYKKGYINIQQHEGKFDLSNTSLQAFNYIKNRRDVNLDFTCKIKENGIQIQMTCKEKDFLNNINTVLNLEKFVPYLLKQKYLR